MPDLTADTVPSRRESSFALVLSASGPAEWLATHLHSFSTHDEYRSPADAPSTWRTVPDLLADDAAELNAMHARLVDSGSPADEAAVAVLGWAAGPLATAIGFAFAYSGAGLCCDRDRTRVRFHPAGWPDAVDLGSPATLVATGHPWAGAAGVHEVADEPTVADAAVAGLVSLARPLVDACRSMAKVGMVGLWNEIGDGATCNVVAYESSRPIIDLVIQRLHLLAAATSAPWRRRGSIWISSTSFGPAYVARRGGCCLAYRSASTSGSDPEEAMCGSCSLRTPESCEQSQLDWHEHEHRREAR